MCILCRLNDIGKMRQIFLSRLMHSARLKWTEGRLLRLVQLLGDKGNWRRAIQVVHWVHCREHFKHCKSRFVCCFPIVCHSLHSPHLLLPDQIHFASLCGQVASFKVLLWSFLCNLTDKLWVVLTGMCIQPCWMC